MVQQNPRVNAAIIEEAYTHSEVCKLYEMLRTGIQICICRRAHGEKWPTFNSIPKWYDAVSQSAGEALDITPPGQWRKHVSIKWVQAGDSLCCSEVTHSASRPVYIHNGTMEILSHVLFLGWRRGGERSAPSALLRRCDFAHLE